MLRDAASRKAVELRAMRLATEALASSWDEVIDVSASESFDLLCKGPHRTLHVEVKGTTSDGASIILTRNEILHARAQYPNIALYVVSHIDLRIIEGTPEASGGVLKSYEPWSVDLFEMLPLSFQCFLATSDASSP